MQQSGMRSFCIGVLGLTCSAVVMAHEGHGAAPGHVHEIIGLVTSSEARWVAGTAILAVLLRKFFMRDARIRNPKE